MIILTAGHTGPNTGAQCATTQFDEGSETIWLRNRVAEILTNKYGLAVLLDNDTASLQLLTQSINALPCRDARFECLDSTRSVNSVSSVDSVRNNNSVRENPTSAASPQSVQFVGDNSNPDDTQNIKTCLLGRDFAQQKQDHYV